MTKLQEEQQQQEQSQESVVHPNSSQSLTLEVENDRPFRLLEEAIGLFQIGLPSVLMQFALYWIFPLSASAVGRGLGVYVYCFAQFRFPYQLFWTFFFITNQ